MSIRDRLSGNEAIATAMRQINPDVFAMFPITPSTEIPQYFAQYVADGKVDMADFVAQFSDDELCTIVRGEGMNSPRVTPGTAGAIGGVSDALQHYGLPAACCSDGPSGIRMDCGTVAFAMPNGTCLAATFNEDLSEELYSMEGLELRKNHVELLAFCFGCLYQGVFVEVCLLELLDKTDCRLFITE